MGLFSKSKEKLLNQDKELLAENLSLMTDVIDACTGGEGDDKALFLKRLGDAKEMLEAFDPFDENNIVNIDKKINEHLKSFVGIITSASGAITREVKAALTDLQDLINSRNDVE